jgi:hypothetical protein
MKLTQTLLHPDRSTSASPVVVRITRQTDQVLVEVSEVITDHEFAVAAVFTRKMINDQLRAEYSDIINQCARAVFGVSAKATRFSPKGSILATNSDISDLMDLVSQHC